MRLLPAALAIAALGTAIAVAYQPQDQPQPGGAKQGEGRGRPDMRQMGSQLLEGLRNSPGCLGVEAAQTRSGKNVIFAWFENKAAAMEWYNSPTHTFMRKAFADGAGAADGGEYQPMAHIPDDVPILTIASLKMAAEGEQRLPGVQIPVTEIAIELYTPLPGGLRYAGGFTPEALHIPHQIRTEAPEQPDAAPGNAGEGRPPSTIKR